ncbi:unnamed protein product, partial [Amoebophrya sp. A25]
APSFTTALTSPTYTSMPDPDTHLPTHALEWWDTREGRTIEDIQMAEETFRILE